MRILPPLSFQEGYEPGSVELNHDEGLLEITHASSVFLQQESKIVAETLILRCTLRPVPLFNKTAKVRLISENELLEEAYLYNEETVSPGYDRPIRQSQWQGIAVEYAGMGQGIHLGETFIFHGTILPTGEIEAKMPLYIKPFQTEETVISVRTTTVAAGQVLTSPPGVLNTRILKGYGGYYQTGIPLGEIEQVYYACTSDYDKTRVRLYTSSALRAQYTPPPRGGRVGTQEVLFTPLPQEEEYLSLPAALAAGYASFSVKTAFGSISYVSTLCEPVSGQSTVVNVHFSRQ